MAAQSDISTPSNFICSLKMSRINFLFPVAGIPLTVLKDVKHFAGYGAPTAGRDYNTVELSEHTFREFYLPSYPAKCLTHAAIA